MSLQTVLTDIHDDIVWSATQSERWDNIQTGAQDYNLFYKEISYTTGSSSVSTIVIPVIPGSFDTGYELKISMGNSFKGTLLSSQDCLLDLKSIRSESLIQSGMPVGSLSLSIFDSQGILSGYGMNGMEQIDINWGIFLNNNNVSFTDPFGSGKLVCRCWGSGLSTIPDWIPIDTAGPVQSYFSNQTFPVIRIQKR